MPTYLGWGISLAVIVIGLSTKEDSSMQTWAKAEVARRREAAAANSAEA
jgi:hypothetical protein